MSSSTDLIRALLKERCPVPADAELVLEMAGHVGVDALDFCIHRYGLGVEVVMRRAADWVGLAFSPVVPSTGARPIEVRHIDAFVEKRSIREKLFDRDVTYIAPRFDDLLHLRSYLAERPQLRRQMCITPAGALRAALAELSAPQLLDESRYRLARRWPLASAGFDLGRKARLTFIGLAAILTALLVLSPILAEALLLPVLGVMLLVPAVFRILALLAAIEAPAPRPRPLEDADLPVYSVLIPLRGEAKMIPLLRRAMSALRYPPEKLDIKFVVEASSPKTIAAVRKLLGDARFELIVVPHADPLTKPKALDYALPFVRGSHVVVYDAEDIPNPDQLRLAAARFAADPGIDCLQAELLIDNARENPLTGLFAGEYASQFGIIMPALVRWGLPMPLGGTSNHFRTKELRDLGGWDAFNVTEDADLGIRLARLRRRTGMLFSQTFEEAPISLSAWMRQRTRWMKGWMQTFIVHNRNPAALCREMGWRGFLGFEIYVASLILSPLLHTAFVVGIMLHALAGGTPLFLFWRVRSFLDLGILVIGYGASFAVVAAGLLRLGQRRLLLQQLLLPLYWVLHSIAMVQAAAELMVRPHFWAKTKHGVTRMERSFGQQASEPAFDGDPVEEGAG